MMSLYALLNRVSKMERKVHPPAKETRLPYLVLDPETDAAWPGYESHNEEHRRLGLRLGLEPKIYTFDPEIDATTTNGGSCALGRRAGPARRASRTQPTR